jgi:hypothetical protein
MSMQAAHVLTPLIEQFPTDREGFQFYLRWGCRGFWRNQSSWLMIGSLKGLGDAASGIRLGNADHVWGVVNENSTKQLPFFM